MLERSDVPRLDLRERMLSELQTAPAVLHQALDLMGSGQVFEAADLLRRELGAAERQHPAWAGPAHCLCACCLKEMKHNRDAIDLARRGRDLGLNTTGWLYYHGVMSTCLNDVDNLEGALEAADEAIGFYEHWQNVEGLSLHLPIRANILKQMASPLSKTPDTTERAKQLILRAVNDELRAISLMGGSWESEKDELKAMQGIAARSGVTSADLDFASDMPHVSQVISTFFEATDLARESVRQYLSMAGHALNQKGERAEAAEWYLRAIKTIPEKEQEDRAFKALLCYFRGSTLLRLHKLDDPEAYALVADPESADVLLEIERLWNDTKRLHSTLDPSFVEEFERQMNPPISAVIEKTDSDPYMKLLRETRRETCT